MNKWLTRRCRQADKPTSESYLPFLEGRASARADTATDFVLADVLPSRSNTDTFLAIGRDVCFEFLTILITSYHDTFVHLIFRNAAPGVESIYRTLTGQARVLNLIPR